MDAQNPYQGPEILVKRPFSLWRFLRRLLVSVIIGFILLLGSCVLLVYIYEDDVKAMIISELNKHLQAEVRVEPQDIDLTVIKTFPKCALRFKNVTAMEATQARQKDTLLHAGTIALSFSLKDLFNKQYNIQQVIISDARLNLAVDKDGRPNYIAWKTDPQAPPGDVKFALEQISLSNVEVDYKNSKARIKVKSRIKDMELKGLFNNSDYALASTGKAFVELVQVQKTKYIREKNLAFAIDVEVKGHSYRFKQADLKLNDMAFNASGSMALADSLRSLDIAYQGKNIEIASVLSLLPEQFKNNINDYSSEGLFYASGSLSYRQGRPLSMESEFGIRQATITYKPQSTRLTGVNLRGKFTLKDKNSRLALKDVSASLGSNSFKGNCEVVNFSDPYITLSAEVNTNLQDLIKFYPIDTVQALSGDLKLNASVEGLVKNMKHPASSGDIKANGTATIRDLKLQFKGSPKVLNVTEGQVQLNASDLQVTSLKLMHGSSDIALVGSMPAFLNYVFDSKAPLTINAQLSSQRFELEDFLVQGSSGGNGTVSVPANLNFNLDATVGKFSFAKFSAEHLAGNIYIKDQKVFVKNVSLDAMDGKATANLFADASGSQIRISAESELTGINIQKLFTAFNNFGQATLQDKHIKGFATASIDFSGTWSKQLVADPASINATSSLLIERGELNDFKPLESLGKYIEVAELQHIKFSTLQSAVEIKNRLITIPKTSINSSAINIQVSGTHTFDNMVDYHIRLLLSELLAKRKRADKKLDDELSLVENDPENKRSVFIVMTGPADHPTIRYDRKGAKEKIKEDIRQEKQNLKSILKEEFGLFKKDTLTKKESNLSDQEFRIDKGTGNKTQKPSLQPKKKEEDDDF